MVVLAKAIYDGTFPLNVMPDAELEWHAATFQERVVNSQVELDPQNQTFPPLTLVS